MPTPNQSVFASRTGIEKTASQAPAGQTKLFN